MTALALDTSVAIPLLVQTHGDHAAVVRWCDGRKVALSGHAVAETYSVLTRLPGLVRLAPLDAAQLLETRFDAPLVLRPATSRRLPQRLGELGIAGGAVYDALVALAAVEHDATLATRDARARSTYEVVGARVVVAG
ncbi:MAG: PIN domain-containing protein [Solirubrobacteraceae bacterium]|nr:PIN domain-containing protein [Solirubrobacteraceae bacterium]